MPGSVVSGAGAVVGLLSRCRRAGWPCRTAGGPWSRAALRPGTVVPAARPGPRRCRLDGDMRPQTPRAALPTVRPLPNNLE
jgi:hypothetical protein